MQKRIFLPDVFDIRKLFTEYRQKLEDALLMSHTVETQVVNRVVDLQRMLHELNCSIAAIEDGKI